MFWCPSGHRSPNCQGFVITLRHTPHSMGLLWTSDRPVAVTSSWQHTTLTIDSHQCARWDSNPQSQQASGRRHTSYTARLLESSVLSSALVMLCVCQLTYILWCKLQYWWQKCASSERSLDTEWRIANTVNVSKKNWQGWRKWRKNTNLSRQDWTTL